MLGLHWVFDGRGCSGPRWNDQAALVEILNEIPAALGLTVVGTPQVFEHRDPSGTVDTFAGIVLIAESHFSVHVRPQDQVVHCDLFSCAAFDVSAARTLVVEAFGCERFEDAVLTRGRDAASSQGEDHAA